MGGSLMSEENKTPLLEVKDLKKWFPAKSSPFSKEKVLDVYKRQSC